MHPRQPDAGPLRVLIAGCGYVGTALGLRLARAGHEVHGLRRSPGGLPDPIRPIAADLTRPAALRTLPRALDVVVYTAAADGREPADYRAAYMDGLRNLLGALEARDRPPRRVLFTSSTGVYGQAGGEWVDEASPARPTRPAGAVLLEAEALLAESPLPATTVRLAGIYGPGRDRRVRLVRQGRAVCPDGPPVYTNRIHRDDCAGALHHLITLPAPEPLYLAADREPAPLCEVYEWLAERLDAPPPRREQAAVRRRGNKRCRSDRLVASGYRFEYPTYREGYGAMLAEASDTGE